MIGRSVRATVAVAVAVVLLAGGLGGCAAESDLSADAATRLQHEVAAVVAAAESGRYDEALASAAAVRTQLERAADAGELSVERYRLVDDALTRTETELTAALAAAAAAADPGPATAGEEPAEPEPEGPRAASTSSRGTAGRVVRARAAATAVATAATTGAGTTDTGDRAARCGRGVIRTPV